MIKKNTMKKIALCLLIVLLSLSSFAFVEEIEAVQGPDDWSQGFQKFGPRVDQVFFSTEGNLLYIDLLFGYLDLVEPDPSPDVSLPNCVNEAYDSLSIVQIDLNNQRFPTSNSDFRKALAHLANKWLWGIEIFNNWGYEIDTPLPISFYEYNNPNVATYPYSRVQAKQILDAAGFINRTGDRYREGPNGEEIELITYSARTGIHHETPIWPKLDEVMNRFIDELDAIDIAVNLIPTYECKTRVGSVVTSNVYPVIRDRNYHFYVDRILVEPNIDYLYTLYHSSFINNVYPDVQLGSNWIEFNNPDYDSVSSNLMYATYGTTNYAYICQEVLANEVALIPIFTEWSPTVHLTNYGNHDEEEQYAGREWLHVVNEDGKGFNNYWTFLNMYPAGFERGGTIRYGLKNPLSRLNPVYSENEAEWDFLYLIYDTLIRNNPYDPFDYIPWLAESYELGDWGGGTKITLHIIPNILWSDIVPFSAYDVKFSIEYMQSAGGGWHYSKVANVDHVEVLDGGSTAVIYLNAGDIALGWFSAIPILPKHIFDGEDPWRDPEEYDGFIGTGPYRCYKDGVVGRLNKQESEYWLLESNPVYFRMLVWPDVTAGPGTPPGAKDQIVGLDDFMKVTEPGNWLTHENPDGTWPSPPGAWGPECDVNYDGAINAGDLFAICVRYVPGVPSWPPPWYNGASATSSQSLEDLASQTRSAEQESLLVETVVANNAYSEVSLTNSSDPQVSVYPAIIVGALGGTFMVDITVSNVTDLYCWDFLMSFDPNVLNAVNVVEGPFLQVAGDTFWVMPSIDNTAGTIAATDLLFPLPSQGASGSGTLATITFSVQSDGATSLNLNLTQLITVIYGYVVPIDHNVANGYVATTIQAAVDWANTTDTVYVTEGTYHEHVTVDKSLTLIGENVETTTIDGNGTGNVIRVQADNVNISGFSITNGSVGIHLDPTSNTTIVGNKIFNNNIGIKPVHSDNNVVHHNNFINNTFQVKTVDSVNSWDDGAEGNYWNDYNGEDQDDDGIGDTPYVINGQNKDNYPLMNPWNP